MKKIWMILSIVSIMVLMLSACGSEDANKEVETSTVIDKVADSSEAVETMDDATQIEESEATTTEEVVDEETDTEAGSGSADTNEAEPEKVMAPDFLLTNKAGEPISLEKYRGKIVFLNFFTTWCTYCDQEMPDFQEASEKYAEDVEFLIVNSFTSDNVSKEEVYEWYESRGLTMEMVIDEEGILKDLYPIQGFPTTFFIDREGYVIAYYPGVMSMDIVDQVVEEFK